MDTVSIIGSVGLLLLALFAVWELRQVSVTLRRKLVVEREFLLGMLNRLHK